jgi:acetyltransferase-like isoleucine patch superfamily enzyme
MMDDRFRDWKQPAVKEGKLTKFCWLVRHAKKLKVGNRTDIGAFTYINAKNGVTIGDFAQVGSHCAIYSVSTIDGKEGSVVLGKNCKIGSHCVIMPGITVGENAVVGAFSFVTRDIPAGAVAYGVPCRVIRRSAKK